MSATQFHRPGAPAPAAPTHAAVSARRSRVSLWGRSAALVVVAIWGASFAVGFQTGLLILAMAAMAAAIFGLNRPFIGLLGVTMLCTLDSISRVYLLTGGLWRWNTFNYWLLVVMILSIPFLLQLRDSQTRLMELFVLLLVVELLFSDDLVTGTQHAFNVITLFGILAYLGRSSFRADHWHWIAVVNGLLAGVGSFVFYVQKANLPESNPNAWAFFPLTAIFCIALSFTFEGVQRGRWLRALLAGVNATWVFLSGSRGSFLIGICCLIFIVFQLRRSGRLVPVLAAASLLAIGLTSQFARQENQAVYRFHSLFDSRRSMTNRTSGRSELARGGWRIFLEHPLGVGTGGFGNAWAGLENREGMSVFWEGEYSQAHSGWIKTLAENGIPGILLLSAFVLSFAVIGWRTRSIGLFPLGLLATTGLTVAFLADEFQAKGLWLLAATVMTALRRGAGLAARMRATAAVENAPRPADLRWNRRATSTRSGESG